MQYFGKYRGVVKDNKDPLQYGRIRATVPGLAGDVVLDWALPCVPYGACIDPNSENQPAEEKGGFGYWAVPELDTGVWIEFEGGNIDRPIWVGTFWSTPNKNGVPRSNIPSQVLDATDPDTGEKDYPKENTFKSERMRHTGTRRIVVELDQDTSATTPWDDREKYQNPHIEIGRVGDTDEGGKNITDIATSSRDLRIDTERDRNTESERDILDWAHQNVTIAAGENLGTSQSTDDAIGNITEVAANRLNMLAVGSATVNSAPGFNREVVTADAFFGKARFSSGLISSDDVTDTYDSNFNAANITIKLTGQQFAKVEAILNDVIIRSRGNDVYIRSQRDTHIKTGRDLWGELNNGMLIEAQSAGTTPRAIQLHSKGSGSPSFGGPANESGRPTVTPNGSSVNFLREVDERAIKPYNDHYHKIVIPTPEPCNCDPDPGGGIDPGDVIIFDITSEPFSSPASDANVPNGVFGQLQNVAGTLSYVSSDGTNVDYGGLDSIASVLTGVLGILADALYANDVGELMTNLNNLNLLGPGLNKYDNFAENIVNSQYLDGTGTTGQKAVHVNGPDYQSPTEIGTDGPRFSMKVVEITTEAATLGPLVNQTRSATNLKTGLRATGKGFPATFSGAPGSNVATQAGIGLDGYISIPTDMLSDRTINNPFYLPFPDKLFVPRIPNLDRIMALGAPPTCSVGTSPWDYTTSDPMCTELLTSNTVPTERWQTESGTTPETSSASPRKVTTEFSRAN